MLKKNAPLAPKLTSPGGAADPPYFASFDAVRGNEFLESADVAEVVKSYRFTLGFATRTSRVLHLYLKRAGEGLIDVPSSRSNEKNVPAGT